MTTPLRLLVLSLAAALTLSLRAAVPLVNLVDENAPLVVSVRDLPALLKNGADSPWAKTWNDEQMKKFLAPTRAEMGIDKWDEQCKAETGHTVGELVALAKGQVLVALTGTDFFGIEGEPEPSQIPLIVALELGDNADKVAKLIAEVDEKEPGTFRTEEYAGVQLRVYQETAENGGKDEFAWAMVDGIWFLSPAKTSVQTAIDNLKKGRASAPFGESERYLRIAKQSPGAGLTFVCNIQSLYPAAKQALDARAQKQAAQSMGLTPGIVMDVLGFDALRDLYFSIELTPDATLLNSGLTASEQRGLFKMLAFNDGPVPRPDFVSEKWISVSSACFSLPAAYESLKEMLGTLNPMFANLYQGQVKQLNQQLGVDLERDLFGSLGAHLISASSFRPGANPDVPPPMTEIDTLYAISLENAQAFTKAVEALKRMSGPSAEKMFTKREYLGQTIYTVDTSSQPGVATFSYAVTPKYLFISAGTASIIETAIQGLSGKHPTLWNKPDLKAAFAEAPTSACSFGYQDNRVMIGSLIETFVNMGSQMAARRPARVPADDSASEDSGEAAAFAASSGPFDLSAKPDAAAIGKYWGPSIGYVWRDSNGLYLQSKVHHPK